MPLPIYLFNTLTRSKSLLEPVNGDNVGVYACGPTVYHFAHIGNLRAYVAWDILTKTLRRLGYSVNFAMNITDVGHLSSDADEGEDKMITAMRREGKTVWEVAKYYEEAFFKDCAALNIARPNTVCRATEHVAEMIAMVQALEKNGYTYTANGNVYFSTEKFPAYGELWGGDRAVNSEFARVDADEHKKNPRDFVLWFGNSKFKDHAMKWESPWGVGFPGWHIECSAMATKYLGKQFEIHCGGTDHITGHHSNEIAQSEGAIFGQSCGCGHSHGEKKRWVKHWLHNEFLLDNTGKMSKSKGDFLTLEVLKNKGFAPLAYRLFLLGGHYRSQLAFSFEALTAAQNAYNGLREKMQEWQATPADTTLSARGLELQQRFHTALADDLNTPVAVALMWEALKDNSLSIGQRKAILADFDSVLGLGLLAVEKGELSEAELSLFQARAAARAAKDFKKSDELRDALAQLGIIVKDGKEGQTWLRK